MSLNSIIDKAVSDPEFAKRLSRDFAGASREAGLDVSPSEIKAFVGMHGASDEAAVQALQARISHTGLLTGVDFAGEDGAVSPAAENHENDGAETSGTPAAGTATAPHDSTPSVSTDHQSGPDDTKAEAPAKPEAPDKPEAPETKAEAPDKPEAPETKVEAPQAHQAEQDDHDAKEEHGNNGHANAQHSQQGKGDD